MTTATVKSLDVVPARRSEHPVSKAGVDSELINAAHRDARTILQDLASSAAGLTSAQAAQRLTTTGPNEVVHRRGSDGAARLLKTVRNSLVARNVNASIAMSLKSSPKISGKSNAIDARTTTGTVRPTQASADPMARLMLL
jgi:hypothetical protein